ncbi:MAG TPA: XdhC/CoxI family protein [Anaerolineales bacterium]|nr:XdhC/CoxI family protein [Anaerolineales bacterium]
MRDVLPSIQRWLDEGKQVAVATVVSTWGSSPRAVGAKMAISDTLEIAGSVSGGCVEAAVADEALGVLRSGVANMLHFGVADETAWEVGLACGGQIEVFVEPYRRDELTKRLEKSLQEERPAVLAKIVTGPPPVLGRAALFGLGGEMTAGLGLRGDEQVRQLASGLLVHGASRTQALAEDEGEVRVFFEVHRPAPILIIVGGVHIAMALSAQAVSLGYRVYVIEPRAAFATEARFPMVDGLLREWPDKALERLSLTPWTAVAVLTHDPKLDDPALLMALPSPAFYVGALGSQKTQRLRRDRLLAAGLKEDVVDRLRGPIGLELGGGTPEEIALGVMAEVVAVRAGSPLATRS